MLDMLLNGAGVAATGGVSAILGGVFGGVLSWFKGWQEDRHEAKMVELKMQDKALDRQHELACMDREAESAERLALIRSEGEQSVAELSALEQAIKAEARGATWSKAALGNLQGFWAGLVAFLLAMVDVVRGLTRPVITAYLVGLVTVMFVQLMTKVTGIDSNQAFTLVLRIVDMVLFLTCTAVGFWFGSRGTSRKLQPVAAGRVA